MDRPLAGFDHPVWITAGATVAGYLLVLGVLFVLLFLVPFLLW